MNERTNEKKSSKKADERNTHRKHRQDERTLRSLDKQWNRLGNNRQSICWLYNHFFDTLLSFFLPPRLIFQPPRAVITSAITTTNNRGCGGGSEGWNTPDEKSFRFTSPRNWWNMEFQRRECSGKLGALPPPSFGNSPRRDTCGIALPVFYFVRKCMFVVWFDFIQFFPGEDTGWCFRLVRGRGIRWGWGKIFGYLYEGWTSVQMAQWRFRSKCLKFRVVRTVRHFRQTNWHFFKEKIKQLCILHLGSRFLFFGYLN